MCGGELIWKGYPYVVRGLHARSFSSCKLRDGLATCFGNCHLIFSDKEEPKIYTIRHQNVKIASASEAPSQIQLLVLRRSPYFLPSRNLNVFSKIFKIILTSL